MGHRIGNRGSYRTRKCMECTLMRLPLTVLALSCLQLPNTDSETSYHTSWRLDPGQGKVMPSAGSYLNLPQPPINARPSSDNQLNSHRVLHEKNNIGIGKNHRVEDSSTGDISDGEFIKLQEEEWKTAITV